MWDSLRTLWYIKYYSLSNTIGLAFSTNFVSNNFQKICRRTEIDTKNSENKLTNSTLKHFESFNMIYGLNILLTSKQPKEDLLKKKQLEIYSIISKLYQRYFKGHLIHFDYFTFSVISLFFYHLFTKSYTKIIFTSNIYRIYFKVLHSARKINWCTFLSGLSSLLFQTIYIFCS